MKKKIDPNATTKKLHLTRVTVRPLTTEELSAVAGGKPKKGSKAEDCECQTIP